MDIATHYLDNVRKSYRAYKKQAENAFAQLRDEDFFRAVDPESNSIALIVKHMRGNMISRWTDFLTTDGEKPTRQREREFVDTGEHTRAEVMRWWDEGWTRTLTTLDELRPEDLGRTVTVEGKPMTALEAVQRQLAHYAYHGGQIVFLAKHLAGSAWKSLSSPKPGQQGFQGGDPIRPGVGSKSA
jgi:uncharacterized damage-inducible protein DinB